MEPMIVERLEYVMEILLSEFGTILTWMTGRAVKMQRGMLAKL